MTPIRLRRLLRWSHIVTGLLVGSYIYSPLGAEPAFALATQIALVPLLAGTGLAMWQQGRLNRLVR